MAAIEHALGYTPAQRNVRTGFKESRKTSKFNRKSKFEGSGIITGVEDCRMSREKQDKSR